MPKKSQVIDRDLLADAPSGLFRQIVAQTADGVVAIDGNGRVALFNAAAEQMFGRQAKAVLGQSLNILLPKGVRDGHAERVAGFVRSEAVARRMHDRDGNLTGLRADGTEFPVGVSIQKVEFDGEMVMVAHIRDRSERVRLEQNLQRMAETDPLTGALNRRAFLERLQAIHADGLRKRRPYTLILLDLDHFKRVNDSLGHAGGDDVLVAFVEQCQRTLRPGDLFARWGGEEFIAALPETDVSAGAAVGERIRVRVAQQAYPEIAPADFRLTVSMGVAGCEACDQYPDWLIAQADKALYRAKAEGRNRIIWNSSSPAVANRNKKVVSAARK